MNRINRGKHIHSDISIILCNENRTHIFQYIPRDDIFREILVNVLCNTIHFVLKQEL